jgi:hypothetical protein
VGDDSTGVPANDASGDTTKSDAGDGGSKVDTGSAETGGDASTGPDASDAGEESGGEAGSDGGTDAGGDADSGPVGCSGATPVSLTIVNVSGWCTVTVNGAPLVSDSVCVAAGPVALAATANASFQLGATPWHDTVNDTGTGDPGMRTGTGQSMVATTTYNAQGTKGCAWVCCESAPTGGDCPAATANQCN